MSEISKLTIGSIREGLLSRRFSATEIAQQALAFAESENPKTNAYLRLCPERALAAAAKVDAAIAAGEERFQQVTETEEERRQRRQVGRRFP